jgi:hypothetical protein
LRSAKARSTSDGSIVEPHGIDLRQVLLLGLDDVLALVGLLAGEVDGMLEEAKHAILISPAVTAMAMIAGEDTAGSGADLIRPAGPNPARSVRNPASVAAQRDRSGDWNQVITVWPGDERTTPIRNAWLWPGVGFCE